MLAVVMAALAIAAPAILRAARRRTRPVAANNDEWFEAHRKWVARLPENIREAHKHSSNHRAEILQSTLCGCFYCGQIFPPTQIAEWVDQPEGEDEPGTTALCPFCSIDSVIGDRSGFTPTAEFLQEMRSYWF
jgi:hypothetical protein